MTQPLKITRLELRNFLALEEFVIELGKVTRITGPNGAGKTAILSALKILFGGGHDYRLIRNGTDQAEVLIDLSDGLKMRKTIRAKGSTLKVTRDGVTQKRPQSIVDDLLVADGLNPLEALAPANRRAFLLEVLDVRITSDELRKLLGEEPPPVDYDQHALLVLDEVFKYLYGRRTDANALKKSKAAAASEAQAKLPPKPLAYETLDARAGEVEDQLVDTAAALQVEAAKEDAQAEHTARIVAVQAQVNLAQDAADRAQEALGVAERDLATQRGRLDGMRAAEVAAGPDPATVAAANAQQAELLGQRATLAEERTILTDYARVANLEREAQEAARAWSELERKVTAVGPVAQAALVAQAGLPDGLTYVDGDFAVDGIPTATLSQSELLLLAVRLVKLRGHDKSLKIMLLDGAECLDATSLEMLAVAQREDDGWAYVMTTVIEDRAAPLSVEVS